MPRENESYRLIREELKEKFGEKQLLSISDVCSYTGIKDQRTAKNRFNISSYGVTQIDFALKLSHL
jgi:hypothetical protein